MQAASFTVEGRALYGVRGDDGLLAVADDFLASFPTLASVLAAGRLADLPGVCGQPVDDVVFLPPVPEPAKILCVGVNYLPHIREMGREPPSHPLVFVRFANSLTGHGTALTAPDVSGEYDYEGELAVIIGRHCHGVSAEEAMDCVAGYCAFMDGSVRDWQRHTSQFTAGKNFPGSGAAGPWLTTPDQAGPVDQLTLTTRLNGEVMQSASVGDLVFGVPELIAYCSAFAALQPGDVIVTGTPGGVGAARTPPVWLRPGDRLQVDLGAVGCLENTVR